MRLMVLGQDKMVAMVGQVAVVQESLAVGEVTQVVLRHQVKEMQAVERLIQVVTDKQH